MKKLYFIQSQVALSSSFMNFISVVCSVVWLLLPLVSSAQAPTTFYRAFKPTTADTKSEANCIINSTVLTRNRFLSVGSNTDAYSRQSGLGVWSGDSLLSSAPKGTWKASRTYDRRGYSDIGDYSLKYINQSTVTGELNGTYTGHVAVGKRYFVVGSPGIIHCNTWVTIIDPTTRATIWDNIVTMGENDEDGISDGVSAVRDEYSISDFFVLSHVNDFQYTDNNVNRVGIIRYQSSGGTITHQVDWMQQYAYPDYQLYPVSIVQNYYGDITVIGNMVPSDNNAPSCIFAFTVDRLTGAVVSPLYRFSGGGYYDYGDLVANSATNHNGAYDEIVIAGKATPQGQNYTLPMIMTLYPSGALFSCGIYRFKNFSTDDNYLTGQFNNAKMFYEGSGYFDYRLVAAGDIGTQSSYPGVSSAIMMHANNATATPDWYKTQGSNLVNEGYPAQTTARWLVAEPKRPFPPDPYKGEYVYIGTHRDNLSMGILNIASGAFDKQTGFSDNYCTDDPYFVSREQVTTEEQLEIEASNWATSDLLRTETNTITDDPVFCKTTSPYIESGKISTDEQPTQEVRYTEQADIILKYDNVLINYTNSEENVVKLVVSDVLGSTLIQKSIPCSSGNHTFALNVKELKTGAYFVSVISPSNRFNKNIIIVK